MKTLLLLALITISEATIGVFVKLTDGLIAVHTLTFYAMAFARPSFCSSRALWRAANGRDSPKAMCATRPSLAY